MRGRGLPRQVDPAYPDSARFFRERAEQDTWTTFLVLGEGQQVQHAGFLPPQIELRCGGLYDNWLKLKLLVLVGVGVSRPNHIFQLWLDPAAPDERAIIDDLAAQASLRIDFYWQGGVVGSKTVPNTVRAQVQHAVARVAQCATGKFDTAAWADRTSGFKSGWELWNELEPVVPPWEYS